MLYNKYNIKLIVLYFYIKPILHHNNYIMIFFTFKFYKFYNK